MAKKRTKTLRLVKAAKLNVIQVPDIEGPVAQLCWKQSRLMVRCDRRKGHQGKHSWEHVEG